MSKIGSLLALALMAIASANAVAQEAPQLLERMSGTWDMQQRMWPGPGTSAIELPAAVAHREVVDGKYLAEVMEPADGKAAKPASFRRNALINYNPVTRRVEYTSLDTRAPQLMTEISPPVDAGRLPDELKLQGGVFVAPQWGNSRNVTFRYRLTLGGIKDGKQTVRLHLTPQTVLPKKEFLAFEYVYSHRS